jgi:hypothetical protein
MKNELFIIDFVCKILYMFKGVKHSVAHVAHYCSGANTVLGEFSDPKEVFPILECENVRLSDIVEKVAVFHWPGKK